ncbi:MAG: peptidyl-prolyl cis-trans isomerase [Acidobacteria bacterium]|nr:peptidyl-prolyl cis-trans isomerase [Acidobacteriota bacterium]
MKFAQYVMVVGMALSSFFVRSLPVFAEDKPVVEMETSLGTIVIELYPDKAPESVKNFLAYVDSGFYNGTIFHRVIPTFMIQGGGMTQDLQRKSTRAAIKNEANNKLSNKRGTIAMARTGEINSATAQFFINVQDNDGLDYRGDSPDQYGYAVFGKVTAGMDVVDKIRNVKTATNQGYSDVPVDTVLIKSVKRKTTQ